MHLIVRSLYFVALLLCSVSATAQVDLRIGLNQHAWVYIDDSGSQQLQKVSDPAQLLEQFSFQKTTLGEDNWGFSQPVFWVLVPLAFPDRQQKWFLELAYPLLDRVDLFVKFPHSEWVAKTPTGDMRPWGSREVESAAFHFHLPNQATHVLLRLDTQGSMRFPLYLTSESALQSRERQQQFAFGLFFGAMLIMVFYNAVIYLLAREPAYLYYMAILAMATLYQAAMSGYGFMYVWRSSGYWINQHIQPVSVGLVLWFICLFSRDVLDLKQIKPGANRALQWLGLSGLLLAVAGSVLSFSWLIHFTALWPLVVVFAVVASGVYAVRARVRGAGIFILAWVMGFVGVLVYSAQQMGVIPVSWPTENGVRLGILCNVTLLSFVLMSHLQQLKREKEHLAKTAEANYQLALIDGLTGVPNRRAFDDRLSSEFERTQRDGTSMALLMVDVDFFKKFNDAYGHQAGDDALVRVALIMRNCLRRPTDSLYRYGGEEFAIILADTDATGADHIATRIMRSVRNLCVPHKESPHKQLTVSIGIGLSRTKEKGDSIDQLLHRADVALYQAKRQGRNTTCLADRQSGTVVNIGDYFKNTPKDTP
jgi:two-component system, sensor histidine kinase LadS